MENYLSHRQPHCQKLVILQPASRSSYSILPNGSLYLQVDIQVTPLAIMLPIKGLGWTDQYCVDNTVDSQGKVSGIILKCDLEVRGFTWSNMSSI